MNSQHETAPKVGLSIFLRAFLLALIVWTESAIAVPISYIFSGTGSGSLNGTIFLDASFTIAALGDTEDVFEVFPRVLANGNLTGPTIDINGIGTFGFNRATYVFNNSEIVGFGSAIDFDLLNLEAAGQGLLSYGLDTDFGPISGEPICCAARQFVDVPTTGGLLTFLSFGEPGTFQARTSVPEPSTILLLGLGLAGIGFGRYRSRKVA